MFAFTLFFAGFIYLPPRRLDDTMGVNKPLTNWVASRFAQRFVNLVVGANLTDTSDKLTDRYADRQTVPDSINCIVLAPVMDIALARVLIAQSSLEMLSCAAFNCAVKTSPCFVNDVLSSFCFSAISRLANAWQQWGKPKPCWYVIRLYRLKANLDIRGNTDSNMVSEPGGYSIEFYTGRLRIEVQPLILLHTIFDKKKGTLAYTFHFDK